MKCVGLPGQEQELLCFRLVLLFCSSFCFGFTSPPVSPRFWWRSGFGVYVSDWCLLPLSLSYLCGWVGVCNMCVSLAAAAAAAAAGHPTAHALSSPQRTPDRDAPPVMLECSCIKFPLCFIMLVWILMSLCNVEFSEKPKTKQLTAAHTDFSCDHSFIPSLGGGVAPNVDTPAFISWGLI